MHFEIHGRLFFFFSVSLKVVRQGQNHTLVPPTTFQRTYLGKLKLYSPTQILFPPFYWGKLSYCFSPCLSWLPKVELELSAKSLEGSPTWELKKRSRTFWNQLHHRTGTSPHSKSESSLKSEYNLQLQLVTPAPINGYISALSALWELYVFLP